ncbi:MAG: hypothetical protein DCF12_19210 [Snowella sp.]|nr:MAG: hypothetical protein DCF12_19210 [Snowella sp.]
MNQLSIQEWSGEEWEKLIQRLLKRHHGHTNYQEVPAKHGGDLGLEGFSTNGFAYQCYAAQGQRDTKSLYEAQRDKITTDINKFINNGSDLMRLFGDIIICRWCLVVPIYESKQLLEHATKKTQQVLARNLPYVAPDFRIMIVTYQNFEKEIQELATAGVLKIDTTLENIKVEPEIVEQWLSDNSDGELLNKLDFKSRKIKNLVAAQKTEAFKNQIANNYLIGQNLLSELNKKFPDLYSRIKNCKITYETNLALKSLLNTHSPNTHLDNILNEYSNQLSKEIPNLSSSHIQILCYEAISDWLMRCPLDF